MNTAVGTPIILRRRHFIGKVPHTDTMVTLQKVTSAALLVLLENNTKAFIPMKFFTNRYSDTNSTPPVIILPNWFSIEKK